MATRSKKNYRGRAATRRLRNALNIQVRSPGQFRRFFKTGLTVMIVVSDHEGSHPCPHCVTYKPIWDSISTTEGRKVNMVSMPSKVYSQTNLSSSKPVNSVPTVLLVGPDGSVSEVDDIRNKEKMTELVKNPEPSSSPMTESVTAPVSAPSAALHIPGLTETEVPMVAVSSKKMNSITTEPNPLTPLPGTTVTSESTNQKGGDPWSAFMMAAKQAAPAAVLMGAYGALPKRSSGLGRPKKRRTKTRSN
jgi:hypothetical protein